MKTNKLKVNILNATHMQTRVIITVLDFLRAQSTSSVALRAVDSVFSLSGASSVRRTLKNKIR